MNVSSHVGSAVIGLALLMSHSAQAQQDKGHQDAAAVASNGVISNYISGWGHDVRTAIDTIKDRSARTHRIYKADVDWQQKISELKCSPDVPYDFKQRVQDEKEKRFLPVVVHVIATCDEKKGKWSAYLHVESVNDRDINIRAINWTTASKDIFPPAKSFTTDARKKAYAAKFGSDGEYINLINRIACSEADKTVDAVRYEIKRKKEDYKGVFQFTEPALKCTNGHLVAAMSVWVVEPKDSKGKDAKGGSAAKPATGGAKKDEKTKKP